MSTKVLGLPDKHYDLLLELALEERRTIRETINEYEDEDRFEMFERYNLLGAIFNLEEWNED